MRSFRRCSCASRSANERSTSVSLSTRPLYEATSTMTSTTTTPTAMSAGIRQPDRRPKREEAVMGPVVSRSAGSAIPTPGRRAGSALVAPGGLCLLELLVEVGRLHLGRDGTALLGHCASLLGDRLGARRPLGLLDRLLGGRLGLARRLGLLAGSLLGPARLCLRLVLEPSPARFGRL